MALANEQAYFQTHGLKADAPETLNSALQIAISELTRTLYRPSELELTTPELEVLQAAGVDVAEHADEADPIMDYATEFAAIVATSESVATVAGRLKVSEVRVRQLINAKELYAIRVGGRWQIPVFQFRGSQSVPNIGAVNPALDGMDPVSVVRWYTTVDPELERDGLEMSPLDWLCAGLDVAALLAIVPEG